MDARPVDPAEFLDQLRAQNHLFRWEPLAPERRRRFDRDSGPRTAEELDYLHTHWALPDQPDPAAGRGLRGRLRGMSGRLVFGALGRYLREERELLAHLVRLNDALSARCDELADRCQQLADQAVARQEAEAVNLTQLAAWLAAEAAVSAPVTDDAG